MSNLKKKLAKKIADTSNWIARNTIGRSTPACICEVKIPDEVKAYLKEQK